MSKKVYDLFSTSILLGTDKFKKPFRIKIDEFKQGGIIAGSVGTGKTTLRLHIMKQVIQKGYSILDIDYKGDAPRMKYFRKRGLILVPGINLHINLFSKPNNVSEKDFIGILYRSFLETINESEITPPQKIILHNAIKRTIAKQGNLQTFYRNLIIVGIESKDVIDNYQKQSAMALVNKFLWLQNTMGHIFSNSGDCISSSELMRNNVFIDLSEIQHKSSIIHIRFLIDIMMTMIMNEVRDLESQNFTSKDLKIRKLIFLDEAHLLIPPSKNDGLTKLEELVSTLRFKGLSVIATTIDAKLITSILHDSNFIAQFRSQSSIRSNILGNMVKTEELASLLNYQFYLKTGSTNHIPLKLHTYRIKQKIVHQKEYLDKLQKYKIFPNTSFMLNSVSIKILTLEAILYDISLVDPLRKKLGEIAKMKFARINTKAFFVEQNEIQNLLYSACFNFMDDNEIDSNLKDSHIIQAYLFEILLLIFNQNFILAGQHIPSKKQILAFNKNYTDLFLSQKSFIEKIAKNTLLS